MTGLHPGISQRNDILQESGFDSRDARLSIIWTS